MEELAQKWTTDDVADFMVRINLHQYSVIFKDSGIRGEELFDIDQEYLSELGVKSPLHQMRIVELFRRDLAGNTAKYPSDYVMHFLTQNNLEKYSPSLKHHGVDGDMLLEVEEKWMTSVLEEIGVTEVDNFKIRKKFKTFNCKGTSIL